MYSDGFSSSSTGTGGGHNNCCYCCVCAFKYGTRPTAELSKHLEDTPQQFNAQYSVI